jgi:Integrase core domain
MVFSLEDARQKLAKFCEHYNHQRPHSALADRTPAAFAELHRLGKEKASTSLGARNPRRIRGTGLLKAKISSFDWYRNKPETLTPSGTANGGTSP